MNRLTKKYSNGYLPQYERETKENYYDLVYKLGQLEDIEDIKEELGIDLITFSKVLKQKFVFNKEKIKVDLLTIFFDFETNKLYIYGYIKNTFEDVRLYAKDYGKTWALTKEELEDDS